MKRRYKLLIGFIITGIILVVIFFITKDRKVYYLSLGDSLAVGQMPDNSLNKSYGDYIKDYLEDAMRLNRNMRGFKSLRALYLFEKGEKLEAKADELEEKTGKCYDDYRQMACFLRCDADMAEAEYRELQNQKKLIKTQNK